MIGEIGTVFLLILTIYILLKKRSLFKMNLNFTQNFLIKIMIISTLILFSIFFCDKIVAFLFSNKYPSGLLSFYPQINIQLTEFFKVITHLGEPNYIIYFILPFLIYSKIKKQKKFENLIWESLVAMFIGGISSTVLKIVFMRSRPFVYWNNLDFYFIIDVITKKIPFKGAFMSFPSGHTLIAFSFYTFLYYGSKNKYLKLFWISLAILVGISRIYLSQHWFSDVMTSVLIGIFVAKNLQKNIEHNIK